MKGSVNEGNNVRFKAKWKIGEVVEVKNLFNETLGTMVTS
jgi:hypothetical protein